MSMDNVQQSHEAILNCMSEAVYVINTDMEILYANPASETLTGHSIPDAVGKKCKNIFCEESSRCGGTCPPKVAMREQRSILHREAETRSKDGGLRNTQISFSPFYEGDICIGAVVVIKDITEIRRAEEQIKRQNKFLTITIDSLPNPFYVIDADSYIIKIANQACRHDKSPEGKTCYSYTHDKSAPCEDADHPCPLAVVKETKQPYIVEHLHLGATGEFRNYEVHGYPIVDDSGNVVQMIEYSVDITGRKNAELERENLILQLQEALAKVKQLSGFLPICSSCKKIRDDKGYWGQIETYIRDHSEAEFSHSICPDCAKKLYPDFYKEILNKENE
jgi:PAS domain S-box-containing protein